MPELSTLWSDQIDSNGHMLHFHEVIWNARTESDGQFEEAGQQKNLAEPHYLSPYHGLVSNNRHVLLNNCQPPSRPEKDKTTKSAK